LYNTVSPLAVAASVLFLFVFNVPVRRSRSVRCCVAYVAFKPSPDEDVELKYARVAVFALQTRKPGAGACLRDVWRRRADWQSLMETVLNEASECVDVPPAPVSLSQAPTAVASPAQAPAPGDRPRRNAKTPERLDTTPTAKKQRPARKQVVLVPKTATVKTPATPPKPDGGKAAHLTPATPPKPDDGKAAHLALVTPPSNRPLTLSLGATAHPEAVKKNPVVLIDADAHGKRAVVHRSVLTPSITQRARRRGTKRRGRRSDRRS
jgi:hypothetical protein